VIAYQLSKALKAYLQSDTILLPQYTSKYYLVFINKRIGLYTGFVFKPLCYLNGTHTTFVLKETQCYENLKNATELELRGICIDFQCH
jgi:hypothetical protein